MLFSTRCHSLCWCEQMGSGCLRVRLSYSSASFIVFRPWWFRILCYCF